MTEILEKWPSDKLGNGLLANYSGADRSNQVATKMGSGPPKTRLTSRDVIRDVNLTLSLTEAQYAYFQWWVHHKINQGEAWFEMPLRTGAAMHNSKVKFVKIGRGVLQGARWKVQCQVMTRDRPAIDLTEEQLEAMLAHGSMELQHADVVLNSAIED